MNPILMAVVGVLVGAIVAYLMVNAKNASAQKSKEGAAADILAKVGTSLGLTAADQIIALVRQYETKEFQTQTTKEFVSKVKKRQARCRIST